MNDVLLVVNLACACHIIIISITTATMFFVADSLPRPSTFPDTAECGRRTGVPASGLVVGGSVPPWFQVQRGRCCHTLAQPGTAVTARSWLCVA